MNIYVQIFPEKMKRLDYTTHEAPPGEHESTCICCDGRHKTDRVEDQSAISKIQFLNLQADWSSREASVPGKYQYQAPTVFSCSTSTLLCAVSYLTCFSISTH
jgi:hypothetical protein